MPAPSYIEPAYLSVLSGITDVQSVIDAMRTALLAAGWTEPVGNTFQTPINNSGRLFKVAFTRTSATQLDATMTDHLNRSATTMRVQIASGDTIAFYYGAHYLYIEDRSNVAWMFFSMMSLSPESEVATQNYLAYGGNRNSAGTSFTPAPCQALTYNVNAGAYVVPANNVSYNMSFKTLAEGDGNSINGGVLMTVGMARRWYPIWPTGIDSVGAPFRFRGRLYNSVMMLNRAVSIGGTYTIPIDQSTTAAFRILNIPPINATDGMYMRSVRVPV